MASRHLSRSLVLQTLFECDIKGTLSASTDEVLKRNSKDPTHKDADTVFSEGLIKGVLAKLSEIDAVIQKAAPQWPLEKIAPVDRNVLRIGLYELLYADRKAVPPKVALNEAIELAKSYGGDTSGKFVNGVLGAVYRELGEPGKDADQQEVPMREDLGGVLLAARSKGVLHVALVHDAFGKWTLPKAKCKDGDTPLEAALHAIKDELGVTADESKKIGSHKYLAHEPGIGKIERSVEFFLVCLDELVELTCKKCEGITEAKWFPVAALAGLPMYDDLRTLITDGVKEAENICQA